MASLHNPKRNKNQDLLSGWGEAVKHVAELFGKAKGIYDVGRGLYSFGQVAAPAIGPVL